MGHVTQQLSPSELKQRLGKQQVESGVVTPGADFENSRARAAYEAFTDNFDEAQIEAMKRVGISLCWEALDPNVKRGWVRASAVAAAYR